MSKPGDSALESPVFVTYHSDALRHDAKNFFIRCAHPLAPKPSDVADRPLHALAHKALAGIELLPVAVHLIAQDARLHRRGDLRRADGLRAVAHDARM